MLTSSFTLFPSSPQNLYSTTHSLSALAFSSTLLSSEVSLIDSTLGDDASTSFKPHDFKSHSFVTPSICAVCEGSVWGKGLRCGKCSMAVHGKCELKVRYLLLLFLFILVSAPRSMVLTLSLSLRSPLVALPAPEPVSSALRARSMAVPLQPAASRRFPRLLLLLLLPRPVRPPLSSLAFIGVLTVYHPPASSFSSIPPPRRTMPAPGSDSVLPPMPSAASPSAGQLQVVLLYDYAATSEQEMSVSGSSFSSSSLLFPTLTFLEPHHYSTPRLRTSRRRSRHHPRSRRCLRMGEGPRRKRWE